MKKLTLILFAVSSMLAATVQAVPVVYEIQSHSAQNYSASWLHTADNCNAQGLCMSGNSDWGLTGNIEGDLENDVLTITGGSLSAGSYQATILDGVLGGAGSWFLNTTIGNFWFADLTQYGYTEDDQPNSFNGDNFVLWGQNDAAYGNDNFMHMDALGIDIYATKVPEPGSVALLGLGLLGLLARRRLV